MRSGRRGFMSVACELSETKGPAMSDLSDYNNDTDDSHFPRFVQNSTW